MIEAAKIVIAVFILLGALISLAASFGTLRLLTSIRESTPLQKVRH